MTLGPVPRGLCGNKQDHEPHLHMSATLGVLWCHADQKKRIPYALEVRSESKA